MKRPLLIGCLGVAVLVLGTGGALAYTYVVRPAMATMNAAKEIARIPQIENRVTNRAAFVPPGDGVLLEDQVQRYFRATTFLRTELEGRGAELAARFEDLEEREAARAIRQMAIAYADLVRLIVAAKELQVEALNAEGFSMDEYEWVRAQTLAAAGHATYRFDLQEVREGGNALQEIAVDVPEENVELVRDLGFDFEELVPLAALGL